jgi:hypothetical protein
VSFGPPFDAHYTLFPARMKKGSPTPTVGGDPMWMEDGAT